MKRIAYTAERIVIPCARPFEAARAAFEVLLGRADERTVERALAAPDAATLRAEVVGWLGPSGFALFHAMDFGRVMSLLLGRPVRARQYLLGNPLLGAAMAERDAAVAAYVPPRVLLHETAPGAAAFSYDRPSAALAQLGDAAIDAVARGLDEKLERLVASAAGRPAHDGNPLM